MAWIQAFFTAGRSKGLQALCSEITQTSDDFGQMEGGVFLFPYKSILEFALHLAEVVRL